MARAEPTPASLVSAAIGWPAIRRSDPSAHASTSCASPRADFPAAPVPSTMASSSAELNACAPCALRRSLGRSARGNSRILSLFGAFCRAPDVSGDGGASGTVEPQGGGMALPYLPGAEEQHRFDAEAISYQLTAISKTKPSGCLPPGEGRPESSRFADSC